MTKRLYESEIEQIVLDILRDENGYATAFGREISEGKCKEREYTEVVLQGRLRAAIDRLNPAIPAEAREDAARKALRTLSVNLLENNEAFHRMLTDGVDVKFSVGDGKARTDKVWLVDFAVPENNEFLAVNQYTVLENHNKKRPDVVLLLNGLPLVVMELKNAADENADVHAANREELKKMLAVSSGGVVFTTIQKFLPEEMGGSIRCFPSDAISWLSPTRRTAASMILSTAFARHMRDALPNATFIGFTGTPIEKEDKNTQAVFGDYIDVYDIQQAVEDGATVRIYYESRLARIELSREDQRVLDERVEEVTEGDELTERQKRFARWTGKETVVGSAARLQQVAADLVNHFEQRLAAADGKGMIVCMSRRICVDLHDLIIQLRPHWYDADDDKGAIKVIMTGSASDPLNWQEHIRNKPRRKAIGDRLKDPKDPLRLVIVRDMWLTGFDAPCLHTLYVDKPMNGHNLMQAIARSTGCLATRTAA